MAVDLGRVMRQDSGAGASSPSLPAPGASQPALATGSSSPPLRPGPWPGGSLLLDRGGGGGAGIAPGVSTLKCTCSRSLQVQGWSPGANWVELASLPKALGAHPPQGTSWLLPCPPVWPSALLLVLGGLGGYTCRTGQGVPVTGGAGVQVRSRGRSTEKPRCHRPPAEATV